MESPLALYRRYRPETFAEVIGQEHVTEPLRAALAGNRVNHAYLFSGPARVRQDHERPDPGPGPQLRAGAGRRPVRRVRQLPRPGPRRARARSTSSRSTRPPTAASTTRATCGRRRSSRRSKSRYKVYIIDEAHMVSTQGFNALLKLVEEPPEHLRFIFATTEPEKVIPTIRSRTHHYPFRLIPPRLMSSYLSELCREGGVAVEPAALPLVVRAGGGSARDSLSVLDQLIGGAGPGRGHPRARAGLLGYTPDSLLDEVVDAFAAGDGAAVFGVVDKVIESGQDPRRFTEDLLRRLRDLGHRGRGPRRDRERPHRRLRDQGERLVAQAARFGATDLSRAADILATGLTEMRGATAPRLLLELLCARVLLPGADHTTQGVAARLDRLERRASITGTRGRPGGRAPPRRTARPGTPSAAPAGPDPEPAGRRAPEPAARRADAGPGADPSRPPSRRPSPRAPPPARGGAGLTLVDVRRLWPDVVESTKTRRRMAWIHLTQNCQVVGLDGNVLTLGFANAGARDSFESSGCSEVVHQAAIDVVGADWKIETIVDPGAQPEGAPTVTRAATDAAADGGSGGWPRRHGEAGDARRPSQLGGRRGAAGPGARPGCRQAAAREAIQQTRAKGAEVPAPRRPGRRGLGGQP
jgi:DNA polymerase-3 subunit gamma/tau